MKPNKTIPAMMRVVVMGRWMNNSDITSQFQVSSFRSQVHDNLKLETLNLRLIIDFHRRRGACRPHPDRSGCPVHLVPDRLVLWLALSRQESGEVVRRSPLALRVSIHLRSPSRCRSSYRSSPCELQPSYRT